MNQQEQEICTAPKGKLRVVHIDPRDHWPTEEADVDDLDGAKKVLSTMLPCQQETVAVFNDQGKRVTV